MPGVCAELVEEGGARGDAYLKDALPAPSDSMASERPRYLGKRSSQRCSPLQSLNDINTQRHDRFSVCHAQITESERPLNYQAQHGTTPAARAATPCARQLLLCSG